MSKGQDYYRKKIIDESPVQLFAATNTAMLQYPYALGRPNEKSPTLAKQAETYVMDSGIGDTAYDNEDVIEAAESVDADVVIPKDVLHNTSETTDAVVDMAARISELDIDMWVPTQSDSRLTRVQHYDELSDALADIGVDITDHRVAVGGIRDSSIEQQICECLDMDSHTSEEQELHAFGCGFHKEWVAAIQNDRTFVDSMDTSSVNAYVNNGMTVDSTMEPHNHTLPRGTNSTVMGCMERERILYMFNHLVSDNVRQTDTVTEFESDTLSKAFNSRD